MPRTPINICIWPQPPSQNVMFQGPPEAKIRVKKNYSNIVRIFQKIADLQVHSTAQVMRYELVYYLHIHTQSKNFTLYILNWLKHCLPGCNGGKAHNIHYIVLHGAKTPPYSPSGDTCVK